MITLLAEYGDGLKSHIIYSGDDEQEFRTALEGWLRG